METRHKRLIKAGVVLGLFGVMMLGGASGVSAHESRTIGEFVLVVGFLDEPAIEGEVNGLSLRVTKAEQPVEELAASLQGEVIFGDQRRPLTLTPVFNDPGHYDAVFIPSLPGDYTFHITGDLGGTVIDETFTSSPDTFSPVGARAEYEFPATANGAVSNAVAIPALVGGVALALGLGGLAVRQRRALA